MTEQPTEGVVTILFTDLVGSAALKTSQGDVVAQDLVRAHFDLLREQVETHRGREIKTLGDGLMATFVSPRSAVACAIGMQRALADGNRNKPPEQQLQLRVGLNTGEAIRDEGDLFGSTVDAAARICAKAVGGQVLASETVKGVVGAAKDLTFHDRGRFRLKGFPDRWRLLEVAWQQEAPTATAPVLAERTPFVGREKERAELRRLLEQAIAGHGALVVISGEPGVGKTRLAEELAAEARQRGLTERTGRCYEMEGAPPYIPFVEMLEQGLRLLGPEAFRAGLGEHAPEFARILPELRRIFPDIPQPLELPPEQERRYLLNSIREFLEGWSRSNPALLVVDDIHWADDSTLLLLQHVAQHINQMSLLFVATYRDVELDVARPLARTLEGLFRQRLAYRIALSRLPEEGVAAMLRALSGQEAPAPLVHEIFAETEGNAFFVEEVFKHLAEEGKLFDSDGRWRSNLAMGELGVPEGVRLVIGRRLARVSEECRRVLTAAAVVGRGFSFGLLEALVEVDPDTLLDAVDEAERAQLITSSSDGPDARFTFAHELIRQTLISGLSLPRRQRQHLRVADAMERVYARAIDEHAADLAHHLYQAGAAADPEKTVRYLTMAAKRSQASAAFEDALRHYENAFSLLEPDDRRSAADLLYGRGEALRSLGRWEEAHACWLQALAAYEELGDAEAVGRLSFQMVWHLVWLNRTEEAAEIARRDLAIIGEQADANRCRLLAVGGANLSFAGDYAEGQEMIAQALAIAEDLGDKQLLGQVLYYKSGHHFYHLELSDLRGASQRASDLLRAAGDPWFLCDVLWTTQADFLYRGRFQEVVAISDELEPLAARLGHQGALWAARRFRAQVEFMTTSDLGRLEGFVRGELEWALRVDWPWVFFPYGALGLANFYRGRWSDALVAFEEATRLEPSGTFAGWASGLLFMGRAYLGDREAALALLDARRAGLPRPGQASTLGAWGMLVAVVEGLAFLGEHKEAAKLYPAALELINTGAIVLGEFGSMQRCAAIAAASARQWEKAEEHYQTALRLAQELPLKIQQPETRRWYARMLLDRDAPGDRETARRLLNEAIEMYRRIGMPKHVEMAEALLREV